MNKKIVLAILIVALVIGVSFFIRMNQTNFKAEDLPGTSQNTAQENSINVYEDDEDEREEEDEDEYEDEDEDEDNEGVDDNTSSQTTPPSSKSVLLTELSNHDSKSDCWVAYGGKVYDLTSFLPKHKGSSAAIEPYCGTSDGFKNAFEKQHGTSKVSNLMRVGVLIGDFDVMGKI